MNKRDNDVTLVTRDGRRYRIIGKVARILTPKETTPVLCVFDENMSFGLRVRKVVGKKRA